MVYSVKYVTATTVKYDSNHNLIITLGTDSVTNFFLTINKINSQIKLSKMKKFFFMLVSLLLVTGTAVNAQDKIQLKDRIHQKDHLMLHDGSCLLVNAGVSTKLTTPLKLNNGTIVNPDGSYQLQNQQKLQLRDGECLDMNGARYLNQGKFNKRVMMTNKQIEKVRTNATNQNRPANTSGGRRGRN